VAVAAEAQRPAGVTHGTATGTRLRPEDEVTTEAQFQGQEAMYRRRKLLDELVATGVPEVAAVGAGRPRAPMLALLYILIPLIAIAILVGQDDESSAEGGGNGGAAPPSGTVPITAEGVAFDTDEITVKAGEEVTIEFTNNDSVDHNVAVYETPDADQEIFSGETFSGPDTKTYPPFPAPDPGTYYFHCDVHPTMNGDFIVE
jgi:plastocyanin